MLSFEQAQEKLLSQVRKVKGEDWLDLQHCPGKVLAQALIATQDVPALSLIHI